MIIPDDVFRSMVTRVHDSKRLLHEHKIKVRANADTDPSLFQATAILGDLDEILAVIKEENVTGIPVTNGESHS